MYVLELEKEGDCFSADYYQRESVVVRVSNSKAALIEFVDSLDTKERCWDKTKFYQFDGEEFIDFNLYQVEEIKGDK